MNADLRRFLVVIPRSAERDEGSPVPARQRSVRGEILEILRCAQDDSEEEDPRRSAKIRGAVLQSNWPYPRSSASIRGAAFA
jgi:hypothetical protein